MRLSGLLLALVGAAVPAAAAPVPPAHPPLLPDYGETVRDHIRAHVDLVCSALSRLADYIRLFDNFPEPLSPALLEPLHVFARSVASLAPSVPGVPHVSSSDEAAGWLDVVSHRVYEDVGGAVLRTPATAQALATWVLTLRSLDLAVAKLAELSQVNELSRHTDLLQAVFDGGRPLENAYSFARYFGGPRSPESAADLKKAFRLLGKLEAQWDAADKFFRPPDDFDDELPENLGPRDGRHPSPDLSSASFGFSEVQGSASRSPGAFGGQEYLSKFGGTGNGQNGANYPRELVEHKFL